MPDKDQEAYQPLFRDVAFYRRRSKGRWRPVCPPVLPADAAIADTHCHVQSLRDPALSLARCGLLGVGLVFDITDVVDDDPDVYDQVSVAQERAEKVASDIADALASGAPVVAAEAACAHDEEGREVALMPATDAERAQEHEAFERLRTAVLERVARKRAAGERLAPRVVMAAGCHPQLADRFDKAAEARLRSRLADPRCGMLGEIGMDFSLPDPVPEVQERVFRAQLRIANEMGLPVSMHVRDAHKAALKVLLEEGVPQEGAVLHCCALGPDELAPWTGAGCLAGYGGIVTFARSGEARDGARTVPDGQLVVETDCPYMAPAPLRGDENAPEFSLFTAESLARTRGHADEASQEAFYRVLLENAERLAGAKGGGAHVG